MREGWSEGAKKIGLEHKALAEKKLKELGRTNLEEVEPLAFVSYDCMDKLFNKSHGIFQHWGNEYLFRVGTLTDGRNIYCTTLYSELMKSKYPVQDHTQSAKTGGEEK